MQVRQPEQLSEEQVKRAEGFRAAGNVEKALEITGPELAKVQQLLIPLLLLAEDSQNYDQIQTLLSLALIQMDAHKSLANRAVFPRTVLHHIQAGQRAHRLIIKPFEDVAQGLPMNDAGNDYGSEAVRNQVLLMQAAQTLDLMRPALRVASEEMLRRLSEDLDGDHPTKSLSAIEMNISLIGRGAEVDILALREYFGAFKQKTKEKNPDRYAVITAKLIALLWNSETKSTAHHVFLEQLYSEWKELQHIYGWMLGNEIAKRRKAHLRNLAVAMFSLPLILPQERQEMKYGFGV